MDKNRFDDLAKALASGTSRRTALRGILGGAVGTLIAAAGVAETGATRRGRRGKAKKVTICHRTGSAKNPFVTIKISENALAAHKKHGDAEGACKPDGKPCDRDNTCKCGCCTDKVCGCPEPPCESKCYDDDGKCCPCDSDDCKDGPCQEPECEESCTIGYYSQNQCRFPGGISPDDEFPCDTSLTFGEALEQRGQNVVTAQRAAALLNLALGCYPLTADEICAASNEDLSRFNEAGTCPLKGCGNSR